MVGLPNPSFEPKTHRGHQVGRYPAKTAHFVPQSGLFWPKTAPIPTHNGQTKANGSYTVRAPQLPRDQEPFPASSSTICPRNGPKMEKNDLNVRSLCQTRPKPRTGRILGYAAQIQIPRAPSPLATPPLFVVSKPQNPPTRRLDPHTSGHLVEPEGSPARTRLGPRVCPSWSPGRKKLLFQKVFQNHLG